MLADLVESLTSAIETLVVEFGAFGIWLVALCENLFPPTPSEVLYPLAGKMAHDGKISLVVVIIAGVIGSLTGALIYYYLGYRLGDERVRAFIGRYGSFKLIFFTVTIVSLEEYDQGLELFKKRGGIIVFVARIMPLVHGVISIPAGVTRMNLWQFSLYTILGATAWIAPLSLLGYWLGGQWDTVMRWLDVYEYFWYAVIAAFLIFYIWRRWRNS